MKYVKRPIIIEAFRLGLDAYPEWMHDRKDINFRVSTMKLHIRTLEGTMRADIGDYIIKGIQDEIYSCKPDIFEKTYSLLPM